jgi:hypothetical protein
MGEKRVVDGGLDGLAQEGAISIREDEPIVPIHQIYRKP